MEGWFFHLIGGFIGVVFILFWLFVFWLIGRHQISKHWGEL